MEDDYDHIYMGMYNGQYTEMVINSRRKPIYLVEDISSCMVSMDEISRV